MWEVLSNIREAKGKSKGGGSLLAFPWSTSLTAGCVRNLNPVFHGEL